MSRHAVLTIVMVAAISLVAPSPPVQAQDKPSAQELADVPEDNQEARQRFVEALRKYNDLLEGGDAQTQFSLGSMFFTGSDGVPENQALAVTWWRRAAEQGHADAQFNLGVVYSNGNGVPQDDAESVTWYRLAAEQGHADAQNQLGMRYAEGTGVPQDDTEAVAWYRKAAEPRQRRRAVLTSD